MQWFTSHETFPRINIIGHHCPFKIGILAVTLKRLFISPSAATDQGNLFVSESFGQKLELFADTLKIIAVIQGTNTL